MNKTLAAIVCAATLTASLLPITANADAVKKPQYTVLALDTSSSMYEMTTLNNEEVAKITAERAAAKEFCQTALEDKGNKIAIITFDTTSDVMCEFTDDPDTLNLAIDLAFAYGATNFEAAFETSKGLLDKLDASQVDKNIVICSDGLPVRGSELQTYKYTKNDYEGWYIANATLKYDNERVKPDTTVYTVGFYDNLEDKEATFAPMFMNDLANGGSAIAKDGDELDDIFKKFAKKINEVDTPDVPTPDTPTNDPSNNNTNNGGVKSPQTGYSMDTTLITLGMACGAAMLAAHARKRAR